MANNILLALRREHQNNGDATLLRLFKTTLLTTFLLEIKFPKNHCLSMHFMNTKPANNSRHYCCQNTLLT